MNKNDTRVEFEEALIGCLLYCEGRRRDEVLLSSDDFSDPVCKAAFVAISELRAGNYSADLPAVSASMKFSAAEKKRLAPSGRVAAMVANTISDRNLEYYCLRLADEVAKDKIAEIRANVRFRIDAGEDVQAVASEMAEQERIVTERYGKKLDDNDFSEECYQLLNSAIDREPAGELLEVGIPNIDRLTGGLMAGENVMLAARPSCGKTTLAVNIVINRAIRGKKALIYSMEMSKTLIAAKVIGIAAQVNSRKLTRNPASLSDDEVGRLQMNSGHIYDMSKNIFFRQPVSATMAELKTHARKAVREGASLLVVDYLQLMSGPGLSRQEQISGLSREWNLLIKELKVPGIMLSQLSRANEKENRIPHLSDLRDSGAIEQDADIVWFLHPEKPMMAEENTTAKLIQAKGRTSGVGACTLNFNRPTQTFTDKER